MTSPYSGQWTHRLTSTGTSAQTFYYEWKSNQCPPHASEMAQRISRLQSECDLWMFIAWCLHFGILDKMPILTKEQTVRFMANFGRPSPRRTGNGEAARQHRIIMCILMALQCEDDANGDATRDP